MARITSLGRRAARIVSLRRSAAKARRGEPDPSASGPWARAHLDEGSGLLSIVLESTEPTQVRLRQSVASLTAQLDRVDARTHRLTLGAIERYGTITPNRPRDRCPTMPGR